MSKGLKLTFTIAIILVSTSTVMALEPSHPLSQVNPIDEDFNLDGYSINNVNEIRLNDSGNDFLVLKNSTVTNSGGVYRLTLNDNTGAWEFVSTDADIRSNNFTSSTQGNISFSQDTRTHGEIWVPNSTLKYNNRTALAASTGLAKVLKNNNSAGGYLIDMNNNKIINLDDPVNPQDAVNKQYLEQYVANNDGTGTDNQNLSVDTVPINDTISIEGGNSIQIFDNYDQNTDNQTLSFNADVAGTSDEISITGGNTITIDDDFEADTDDQQLSINYNNLNDQISLDNGGTITIQDNNTDADANPSNEIQSLSEVLAEGNTAGSYTIDMNGNLITNLQNPVNPQDAATKDYVDSNEETIADNQTLAEVLSQGNTADRNIDMGRNSITNTLAFAGQNGQDIRSDFDGGNGFMVESPGNVRILELNADGEVEIPSGNLNLRGNNITNLDYLKFEEGTSIDGDLTVNGSVNTTGDLELQDNDLLDANTVQANTLEDPEDGTISINDDINFNSNILDNTNYVQGSNGQDIEFTGGNINLRDTSNNDVIRANDGGNVEIPNGNLNLNGNEVNNVYEITADQSGSRIRFDSSTTRVDVPSGGNLRFLDRGSSYNSILDLTSGGPVKIRGPASNQDVLVARDGGSVDIPNGNLDVNNARLAGDGSQAYLGTTSSGGGVWIQTDSMSQNALYASSTGDIQIPNGNLQLGGNNIANVANLYQDNSQTNFFASDCAQGSVVIGVDSDGTYNCASTSSQVTDIWVNETGDTMSGNLNMNENEIQGIDRLEDNVGTTTVEFDGSNNVRIPNGNLNVTGESRIIDPGNAGQGVLRFGSGDNAAVRGNSVNGVELLDDTTVNLRVRPNGNTEIPNGNLDVSGRVRVNNEARYEGQRVATSAIGDWSVWDQNNGQEIAVFNEGGNVEIPNGNLQMNGNRVSYQDGSLAAFETFDAGNAYAVESGSGTRLITANSGGSVEVPSGKLVATGSSAAGETVFEIQSSDGESLSFVERTSGSQNNVALQNPDGTQLFRWPDAVPRTWVTAPLEMRGDNMIRTGGGGGTQTGFYDSANSQNILVAYEGGNVQVPNGNIQASQGIDVGSVGVASTAGEVTVENGLSFTNNAVSLNRGTRTASSGSLVLDSYDDTLVYSANGAGNVAWFRSNGSVEIPNGGLSMNGNNITDVDYLKFEDGTTFGDGEIETLNSIEGSGNTVKVKDNLDMQDNDIQDVSNLYGDDSQTNFFNDACGQGTVITSINSDGTFNCASTSGQVTDIWVNETGDTMTGDLNMDNNNINEVESLDSDGSTTNLDLVDGGNVNIPNGDLDVNSPSNTGGALDVGGQVKADNGVDSYGNIDMNENEIQNIDRLEDNSGTPTVEFDGSNNVEIPNGNLNIESGSYDSSSTPAALQVGGAFMRIGDVNSGQTQSNGIGIKFEDNGVAHGSLKWDSNNEEFVLCESSGNSVLDCDGGTRSLVANTNNQNVEIPNGDLQIQQRIVDAGGTDIVTAVNSGRRNFDDGSGNNLVSIGGDGGSNIAGQTTVQSSSGADTTRFLDNNNVEIPNGNLNMMANHVRNVASVDLSDTSGSGADYTIQERSATGDLTVRNTNSGQNIVRVDDSGNVNEVGNINMGNDNVNNVQSIDGGGDAVRVDDNIDTNGNSLTSSGGEMCIGDQCA